MSNIKLWSTTPASNNSSPPQGAPEGMAPSTVNDIMRQQMSDHRTQWEDAQWFDYGFSISYVSSTVLKFHQTSQTALTHYGRRVKAGVGAGVVYGSIVSTSITSSDTVFTVTWDSGSADASLSYIELSTSTFTNPSYPQGNVLKYMPVSTQRSATFPDANLTFSAIAAKGDLSAGSAVGVLSTLTVGSADQILAVDSTQTTGLVWRHKITLGTLQASTSGTAIDFSSIPSWVKKISLSFIGISTSGVSPVIIQIGDSGGIEATNYFSSGTSVTASTAASANSTTGFPIVISSAASDVMHGMATLILHDSGTWAFSSILANSAGAQTQYAGGSKALSGTLDRLRITTASGVPTFDAGAINILYE